MINFDNAVKIVREKFPKFYIKSGFHYNNQYIFSLLSKDFENYYTNQGFSACVTDEGKLITFDSNMIDKDPDAYLAAKKRATIVDKVDTSKLDEIFKKQLGF